MNFEIARIAARALAAASLIFAGAVFPQEKVGDRRDGGTVVVTQQLIRPTGDVVEFPGRPVDLALAPGGKFVYLKDGRGIVVIDSGKWSVRQQLKFPSGGGSMHGIAISHDGKHLYATGAGSTLWIGAINPDDGTVAWLGDGLELGEFAVNPPKKKREGSYPCGIVISKDDAQAFVCLSITNQLVVIDLAKLKAIKTIDVGIAPYEVVLSPDEAMAFVSNWGGRHPVNGDRTALSAGTPAVVDERGIASNGTVGIIDLHGGLMTAEVSVGLHPAGMAMDHAGKTLFVANANSDSVSAIDIASRKVTGTLSVRPDPSLLFGSAPNAVCLSADEKTLYVANAGNDAVAVIDITQGKPTGFIPAGWYPGAIASDGKRLFIVNVKGRGSRDQAKVKTGWNSYYYSGTINRVALPDADTLAKYTKQVMADARVPEALRAAEKAHDGVAPVPVPAHVGEPSVFEHIVYVIKENRTYDQVLGDMKQGNGDPSLCMYPRKVTPNHHAIAERYALLDNYYCNGVLSADGHQWAVEGDVVDGLEKSFGGWTRSYPFAGDDALGFVSSGFIWNDVLAHGLTFRNYGEMSDGRTVPKGIPFADILKDHTAQAGKIQFATDIYIDDLRQYSCPGYPGWDLGIPDIARLDVFLKEFRQFEADGRMPNLTIVYLPNDHTRGTSSGAPNPDAMLADNDLAVGKLVEALSHSRFWPKTCVFVIEDDPQNGFDHVDGHRSLCLVASPYTKRHATVSAFYNQTSVLRTIELMLGLPPMNQMDAMAPVMRECFTNDADFTPYNALANEIALDQANAGFDQLHGDALAWARRSAEQKTDRPDQIDDDTFNRVLWFAAKGPNVPYPTALAGSHGRGLSKLGLKLDGKPPIKDDDD